MPGAQPQTLLQTLFSGRILRQNLVQDKHIRPWLRLVFDRSELPFSWNSAMSEMRKPFAPSRRINTGVHGTPAKYINFNLFWIAPVPRLNHTYVICTVQIPLTVLLALGLCSHHKSLYHRPWNASLIESNKVAERAAASPAVDQYCFHTSAEVTATVSREKVIETGGSEWAEHGCNGTSRPNLCNRIQLIRSLWWTWH